ncbi:MAG: DNA polymerase III subunit delta [Oscillospiraceae bacterium]|jgi:DNA polymerase-3 subunit delta|nr:DNA polymerase III subunit delta [Oscillospiraceae bacterium]
MAVKKKTGGNAAYKQLKADLAAGTLGPLYLFQGEESYLREYCLTEMRKQLVPAGFEAFNYHKLEGKGLTAQALTDTVEAMPMMAERTMVQVVDWDVYKLPEEQRSGLISLLEDFPSYCCLVLVYDQLPYKPNRTYKKLYAALDKHVQQVDFEEQSQSEILKWVARRFRAAGHSIDAPTAEHLLFTCGRLMNGLIPEIGKIAAYARDERITRADIDAVAAPVLEAQVFDMTKAVAKGSFDRAAEVLGSLLQLQEEPFMLLALMGRELRMLYTARIALDEGRDQFWLMEQWNMRSNYQAGLLLENARRVTRPWCADAVRRCCELDVRMKSVSGVDGAGELKLLLMELAQGARR